MASSEHRGAAAYAELVRPGRTAGLPAVNTPCILAQVHGRLEFTWDPAKARKNLRKHGVSFGEAETVFYDDRARLIDDPDHSESEDRFILVGLSRALRMLVVVPCLPGVRRRDSHHLSPKGDASGTHGVRRVGTRS